ncbi:alpha/beta fold hydrolase [Cryptosporangium aurantiacum]|uniref:Prolyl oligopeptidase family protein n=1 Tax=Cryptosporangium aurantiacum TaxID=134849 RepID=A0A1M7QVM3_9ACTN|nr:alpha/beta fold hydrolase [Cryptosporangium aurantiacum]SHN35806.1 Prolyl oligopeptidase family protein [Cryptosporangium aurantiacum]
MTPQRLIVAFLTLVLALGSAGTAVAAPAPAVRTVQVTSFDGTPIVTHFFPAAGLTAGKKAPTVLVGPGWGQPGESNPDAPAVAGLRQHGYNVVTWDPRGFGRSGGAASVDLYRYEGRDMQRLLSWLAGQPEAQLDRRGDPRVGMAGGSYGGGIQFVTAALDRRVDAIVPEIAWNSLVNSLYPNRTPKTGWGNLLCRFGSAGTNRVVEQVQTTCGLAATGGLPDAALEAWWRDHGPAGRLISQVRVPTMILQGTVDTLFPLSEGIANYQALRKRGTPVKMVWFCGGHGVCNTPPGQGGHVDALTVAWFDRWLKRSRSVSTGPGFEYVDDAGVWRGARAYPLAGTRRTSTTGSGTLAFSPADTSGTDIAAQPATNAVRIAGPKAPGRQVVGAPTLTLTYRGTGDAPRTSLFAQVVDVSRNVVAGNFATAVPVVLDGKQHTVSVPLGAVAWSSGTLELQITGASRLYYPQRATGSVTIRATVRYPVTAPAHAVSFSGS